MRNQDPHYDLPLLVENLKGYFLKDFFEHCFTCRLSDSTVSEDAGKEPRTAGNFGIGSQSLYKNSARSHPTGTSVENIEEGIAASKIPHCKNLAIFFLFLSKQFVLFH
jgi:hypothetical protein